MGRATHIRKKTGEKVYVENSYGVFVIHKLSGQVLTSFDPENRSKFYKRYKSIKAKNARSM